MIKYGILVAGLAFYFFAISTLIGTIRDQNFTRSFIRLLDGNDDGVITSKEIKAFKPCDDYDGKKLNKIFSDYGKKADINDLAIEITPKQVISSISKCVDGVEELTSEKNIKDLTKEEVTEKFLAAYDINDDKEIRFSEFVLSNQNLAKPPKNLKQIFVYFDKNRDWVISEKELVKSKPKNIGAFLLNGKRK